MSKKDKRAMSSEDKRRKWILSLGFSEEEADSFIEFEVPNWKIEALAEVLHPEPEPAPEPIPVPPAEVATEGKGEPSIPGIEQREEGETVVPPAPEESGEEIKE